jgi:hypothetical protein
MGFKDIIFSRGDFRMAMDELKRKIVEVIKNYPVNRVVLFGSRASGINRDDSDVDLIVEFSEPVTLLTLSKLTIELEEVLGVEVDVIHGPMQDDDMIEIGATVELYAA